MSFGGSLSGSGFGQQSGFATGQGFTMASSSESFDKTPDEDAGDLAAMAAFGGGQTGVGPSFGSDGGFDTRTAGRSAGTSGLGSSGQPSLDGFGMTLERAPEAGVDEEADE